MENGHELSANQRDMAGCGMFFAFVIMLAIVVYSDILFLQIMWNVFPDGLLRIGAVVGALATGMSIALLVIGKSYWFRPGYQMLAAWGFTFVEVGVSMLNVMLAYEIFHDHHSSGILSYWQLLAPVTPLVALIGWIVIWQLDNASKMRHANLEVRDAEETSELQYRKKAHQAKMMVKDQHLSQVTQQLKVVLNSQEIQDKIAQHALMMVENVLTDVTGTSSYISSPNPLKMVDSRAPVQLQQTAHLPATEEVDTTDDDPPPTPVGAKKKIIPTVKSLWKKFLTVGHQ